MKRCFTILGVLAVTGLVSCIVTPAHVHEVSVYREGASPGEVVIEQEPPAPQTEVVTVSPGPDYVWVPGYWWWTDHWVWVGGVWARPPRHGSIWVRGEWSRRGRGWAWRGGRWR